MKALVYYGPHDMKVAEYQEPVKQKGEALLRVAAVGICGSDVHGYLGLTGRRLPPMIMGHEVVAEVLETAGADAMYKRGDMVFVDPITVCGTCENCKAGNTSICLHKKNIGVLADNGAFCEYIAMREENLIPMPDGVDAKVGVLAEPFSVALHAVNQLSKENADARDAAVIGAGVIGICTAAILKERYPGSNVVILDVDARRLERCANILGAAVSLMNLGVRSYEEIREECTENGFDIVMEAVGIEPTVNGALELVKSKGSVVLIGNHEKSIQLAYQQIVTREIRVWGTYGFTHGDLEESIEKFGERKYAKEMIDAVVPLEQAKEYFDRLAGKGGEYLKVVVEPGL